MQSKTGTSNITIAKNTLMLYFRMLISICINLYTSRILLRLLGVDDFGIYSLVGGIVALMGFLNTSMAGSSSRFLAYEISRGNPYILRRTFSSSMQAHIIIAAVILLVGESLGLWFINTQLVIPESRMYAANVVYQFSLFSSVITFLQVPYSADVIAHEKMDVYALIEICNVTLKLGGVLLLKVISSDRLIMYPILLSAVAVVIFLTYRTYSKRKFQEAVLLPIIDKEILLPMLKFSGWDLYGNACVITGQQGTNILLNRFFGVAVNAAAGIANQAGSAVILFVSNITMSLRPPIIKLYASNDIKSMQNLLTFAIVICLALAEIICLPLWLRIEVIMKLWLSDVPAYASDFCKWILLANSISVVNPLFVSVIHSTGKIKNISIITGSLYLLSLFFVYIAYIIYDNPVMTYKLNVIISVAVIISNLLIIRRQIPSISLDSIFRSVLRPIICLACTIIICVVISEFFPQSVFGFIMLFAVNAIILTLLLYLTWIGPNYSWNILSLIKKNRNE